MAHILNQEEQNKALKNINDSIRAMKRVNELLSAQNPSGIYTLSCKDTEDKKCAAEIHVPDKATIVNLLMAFKEQEKQRITALAQANLIDLDEKDHEILNFHL